MANVTFSSALPEDFRIRDLFSATGTNLVLFKVSQSDGTVQTRTAYGSGGNREFDLTFVARGSANIENFPISTMTAKIHGTTYFTWDSSAAPLTVANIEEFHDGKAASAAILMSGNDTIIGSANGNYLEGFAGGDTIDGGNDTDILIGGLGKDTLIGGDDGDRFVFKSVKESTVKIAGRDIIQDFSRGDKDKIDLDAIDANEDRGRNQDFHFIGQAKFHKNPGELRYEKFIDGVVVYGDTDGNGKPDFSIELPGLVGLKGGDFLL
jgi:Ca2+-binding RTX toxin-like protein